jgi:hypothetical protein
MKVQMIGATDIALACAIGRHLDKVKPQAGMVADQRTELQITWPRNGAGDYATIVELMHEATRP